MSDICAKCGKIIIRVDDSIFCYSCKEKVKDNKKVDKDKDKDNFKHKEIYNMKLHDILILGSGAEVIRVPGGWIYEIKTYDLVNHTFVPFNNEFMKED